VTVGDAEIVGVIEIVGVEVFVDDSLCELDRLGV